MKYIVLILLGLTIGHCTTSLFKSNPPQNDGEFNINEGITNITQTIDTIICTQMDGYTEDLATGEKCLVIWDECDTIYKTK